MEVLSTTNYIVSALKNKVRSIYPGYYATYSQNLEYPYSDIVLRANDPKLKNTGLPLFGYNRSPLRQSVPVGGRGNRFQAYANNPGNANPDVTTYRTAHLEFDFNFVLVDKNVDTIENFEIEYLSKEGLGRITELDVDFSAADLGTLRYFIEWQPVLSNFITNTQENNYSSISGTAKVRGWFVSLYGTTPIITNIQTQLNNSLEEPIDTLYNP